MTRITIETPDYYELREHQSVREVVLAMLDDSERVIFYSAQNRSVRALEEMGSQGDDRNRTGGGVPS